MTTKLYLENSYEKEFSACVQRIEGKRVMLDQTHFFIQGCGQSGDSGEMNGIPVLETFKEGFHLLAKAPNFSVGEVVDCKIDWKKRYRTMRLHTAAEVTEHFLRLHCGSPKALKTNVNSKRDFTDWQMELPPQEVQKEIEESCNQFIEEGGTVEISVDEEGYRHWRCKGVHHGCGGTHVQSLEEVGAVRITFQQKSPGVVRVLTLLSG